MKIAFLQLGGIPCNGNSVLEKALGGTESAMIDMAHSLSERGHQVWVFCEADKIGMIQGVCYAHWKSFEKFCLSQKQLPYFDIVIGIRAMLPFMVGRWGKVQIYFSPDADDQPFVNQLYSIQISKDENAFEIGLYGLKFTHRFADAIFCVGNWQRETFISKFGIPSDRIHTVYNGVNPELFFDLPLQKRKPKLIYTSTPFRGLEFLLKYFPEIKRRVPQATCDVFSGAQIYGLSDLLDQKKYQAIYDLAKNQSGVVLHGPVAKPELAQHLSQSRVWAYPNIFPETFCMAALEASASGLPLVSTSYAGMKERITSEENGFLISGFPDQIQYANQFIDRCVALLTQDELWNQLHLKNRLSTHRYAYPILAAQWENLFEMHLDLASPDSNSWAPFVPQAIQTKMMINGYPKQVSLSQEFVSRHWIDVLEKHHFFNTAHLYRQKGQKPESSFRTV